MFGLCSVVPLLPPPTRRHKRRNAPCTTPPYFPVHVLGAPSPLKASFACNPFRLLHFRCLYPPLPQLRSARAEGASQVTFRCNPRVFKMLIG